MADPRRDDHARIYAEWHRTASDRDGAALIPLYADDAITKPLRGSRDRIDRGEFLFRDRYHIGHSLFAGLAGRKACERRSCFRGCQYTRFQPCSFPSATSPSTSARPAPVPRGPLPLQISRNCARQRCVRRDRDEPAAQYGSSPDSPLERTGFELAVPVYVRLLTR